MSTQSTPRCAPIATDHRITLPCISGFLLPLLQAVAIITATRCPSRKPGPGPGVKFHSLEENEAIYCDMAHPTLSTPSYPITHHPIPSHHTSHHITSHHITSHITSHHTPQIAPHMTSHITHHISHISSHRIASHHITSHHITSHHVTSHHITSPHIILHHSVVPERNVKQLHETGRECSEINIT